MDVEERSSQRVYRGKIARLSDREMPDSRTCFSAKLCRLFVVSGVAFSVIATGACASVSESAVPVAAAKRASVATSLLLPVASNDASWGSATAPVTIFAFLDLECPYCAEVHPTLRELQRRYGPERLRIVFKHAPMPFHKLAMQAAQAASLVFERRGVDALTEFMGELLQSRQLGDAALQAYAARQGVSLPPRAASEWSRASAAVRADLQTADRLGVSGVPTFFVNGARLVGAVGIEEFAIPIEHELTAAAELQKTGVAPDLVFASRVSVNYQPKIEEGTTASEPAWLVPIAGSPAIGAAEPWVTIVEFVDFECPYCQRVHATIQRLLTDYPNRVRWVMKQNPQPYHKQAVPAAVLALEVFRQRGPGAFFAAAYQMAEAENIGPELFARLAAEHRLDPEKLRLANALGANDPSIVLDQDLAGDLEANGTPHFFINGQRLVGARPIEEFRSLVEAEIARVQALVGTGPSARVSAGIYDELQLRASPGPGLVQVAPPSLDADTPRLGPTDAPVTIQVFSDFECSYCRRVMFTLRQLRDRYPTQIQFAWRQLPLSFHRQAQQAALASIEVREQLGDTAFWQMADRMFGLGESGLSLSKGARRKAQPDALDAKTLVAHATALGADPSRFARALEERAHLGQVEKDKRLASKLGISGTPAVLINGYLVTGAQPLRRFERLVKLTLQN